VVRERTTRAGLGSWRLKLIVHESSFVRSCYQRANGERSRRKDAGRSPLEFLDELRATYNRIVGGPLKYQELRGGIRRVLLRRFPYAVYFAIEGDIAVVVGVLHASRDPAEWQRRRG